MGKFKNILENRYIVFKILVTEYPTFVQGTHEGLMDFSKTNFV
ncbi:MAG: hypothetical protein SFW66_09115 [Gammaproteobacteria bacterium]|nr:hypothetical protein [Gammaproteobacteria bacterium]